MDIEKNTESDNKLFEINLIVRFKLYKFNYYKYEYIIYKTTFAINLII